MFMSVVTGAVDQEVETLARAHWHDTGPAGARHPGGTATLEQGSGLGFIISHAALSGTGVKSHAFAPPQGDWAFRIDEVAFPVGAVAHRHTHSGSGWRHLVAGSLRIEAEDHTTIMQPGDSWFEPAETPVRAVALQSTGVTRFVRCMAIPAADIGRSTFQLVNPEDAALPRLQLTHRHFDHPVQVEAG